MKNGSKKNSIVAMSKLNRQLHYSINANHGLAILLCCSGLIKQTNKKKISLNFKNDIFYSWTIQLLFVNKYNSFPKHDTTEQRLLSVMSTVDEAAAAFTINERLTL